MCMIYLRSSLAQFVVEELKLSRLTMLLGIIVIIAFTIVIFKGLVLDYPIINRVSQLIIVIVGL